GGDHANQVVLSADGREQLRSADGRDRARHTEDHSRHGPTPHLAQRRGTRRTPLCPPFARGEKGPDAADFPPLAKGGSIVFGTVSACCPSLHIQRLPVNLICLIFI